MSVSAVLLAYKEAENLKVMLPAVIEQLKKIGEEYEVLVIDTAEPLDNTEEVCRQFGVKYFNQELPGFGGAFQKGIKEASCDKFLILDSDGSHDPKYFPDIFRKMTPGVDVVIGSRYAKGGKNNDAFISVLMSKTLNFVFRIALGIKARDISTNYRLYRTDQLKKVSLDCRNYDVLEEVLLKLKLKKKNLRIEEIPIVFNKRLFGESKRQLLPFIISYLKTLFRLIRMRMTYKG
ncbi:MAG: glycosyltransferase [Oscillospiraceae bacterium]|nr:glycosyltransferase [Oscillospiraceae bacterium]